MAAVPRHGAAQSGGAIGTPAVPVLNLLSAVDNFFGSGAVSPVDLSPATTMGELFAYGYTKKSEYVHSVAADVSQSPWKLYPYEYHRVKN